MKSLPGFAHLKLHDSTLLERRGAASSRRVGGDHRVAQSIHERALAMSLAYKRCESDLVELISQVELHRVHLSQGKSSVFRYVTECLGLSESVAYNLIAVSRKARAVPALMSALREGRLSLSNARKITPVLSQENSEEWISKATRLSQRQLEKEIVSVRPLGAVAEKVRYATRERLCLQVGISERSLLRLRRAQDLVSQARKRAVGLEETIELLTEEYLERHDPVAKAKRQVARKGVRPVSKSPEPVSLQAEHPEPVSLQGQPRTPIPAHVRHVVNLRDQGRCTYQHDGKRCNETRWLDLHHLVPVSESGTHVPDNLTTLCSAHHRWHHARR